STCPAA
nr:Chain X, PEPTIDE [Homo sapiens]4D0Z_Y Chain Y, PEPTIDE [Homo sapiens]4D11_L Chain L, PEPTIDE [Homo sapiens]4D11_O Chain O, PEPTIDE [Homo sapiens]4D11_P Chain P, PEPTIDE [Homo sapiens]4D11_X Chain X, PEPTIDE [Homo sapiens]4D11_Z Chain Z, PEPTIDE [Homo sapiens]